MRWIKVGDRLPEEPYELEYVVKTSRGWREVADYESYGKWISNNLLPNESVIEWLDESNEFKFGK